MARICQVHGTDPRRLLEAAASGLLTAPAAPPSVHFPSPDSLLAVRQGGVRDDLLARLAARGLPGWFDTPLIVFAELPARLGQTERRPLGDAERALLLGQALREVPGGRFADSRRGADFLDHVDRHFGELIAEDVSPGRYRAALAAVPDRDDFERRRDADLGTCYAAYVARLEQHGRRDGRDTLVDSARALLADASGLAARLGGRRELRLYGLSDLRGGWRPLLSALASTSALDLVTLFVAEPLDLGELPHETVALPPSDLIADRLFAGGAGRGGRVTLIRAPDADREIEAVACRVRELADGGVPLDRIAVVARSARPYLDLVASQLERLGVPVQVRRRVALSELPVVRAMLVLFQAAAEGWSRHGLVELAEHPYLGNGLDAELLSFVGYRERLRGLSAWEEALARLVASARAAQERPDDREREPQLPNIERVEAALGAFRAFAERARALDTSRSLRGWLEWLAAFLAEDPWRIAARIYDLPPRGPEDWVRLRIARGDAAGWRGMAAIIGDWRSAVADWGSGEEPLAVERFDARLREMLAGDAVFWSETHRGVRVLEGLAAAHRAFPHLFLVGLTGEHFPKAAPASPLFTEEERARLAVAGLPLERRALWQARERALFRQLVAAAGELTVSCPMLDETGRETVPSAFLDELQRVATVSEESIPTHRVLTPGIPLIADQDAARHAERVARIEQRRATGELSPWNGQIEEPGLLTWLAAQRGESYPWSPTQLESYAKCPWAYFSGRLLGLETLEEPEVGIDAATKGSLLHDALARFYGLAQAITGHPVLLRDVHRDALRPILATALDAAIAELAPGDWPERPELRAIRRAEWLGQLQQLVDKEIERNEGTFDPRTRTNAARSIRTAVESHELALPTVSVTREGVTFGFRGRLDRVETSVEDRADAGQLLAAVDYKSSEPSPYSGGKAQFWEDGVLLQMPLYAHALTQVRGGAGVARVGYLSLKKGEFFHDLEFLRLDSRRQSLVEVEPDRERLEGALVAAARHVAAVRAGRFPAAPPPSCSCPPWCHGIDICRIAGGPKRSRGGAR